MIKLMITMVSVLLSVTSFAQSETKNILVSEILLADIRGVGCHGGSGLCSVVSENSKENTTAVVTKQSLNTILLIIDANKLTIEEQANCFGKEYSKMTTDDTLLFAQAADFVFDAKTLISLGLESKYTTIKKGNYPCAISQDKIQVKMTLWEH